MNILTFVGNLTRDAERKFTTKGTAVLEFAVGNTVGYGDHESTNFYRCSLFGKRAEGGLGDYLKKGQQVCVSGSHRVREYDRKEGGKGWSSEVMVNEVTLCGKREGS